jgi:hypothetical protein
MSPTSYRTAPPRADGFRLRPVHPGDNRIDVSQAPICQAPHLSGTITVMGIFRRRNSDDGVAADDFRDLADEVTELRQILDRRLSAPTTPPPRLVDVDEVDAAIADLRSHLSRIESQMGQIDQRMTAVSTELANQINELSDEIEQGVLGEDGDTVALDERLAELRRAQEHLANEQVRYQIALRDDLAELAERLKR